MPTALHARGRPAASRLRAGPDGSGAGPARGYPCPDAVRPTAATIPVVLALVVLTLLGVPSGANATSPDAAVDARTLIRGLAKPPPATIDFTEVRFSSLLKQPALVSGTLGYESATALDRNVTRPYRETTHIRGGSVRIQREGEPERSFALKRAPELQGLLQAFTALLAGDPAAVERDFQTTVSGDLDDWQISLRPRDARLAKRVDQIRIDGHNDLPRCFAVIENGTGASIMLLGLVTHLELPQPLTREWLQRKCASPQQ